MACSSRPIPNQPYFDVVNPGRQINLGEAAVLAGITRDDMFALNPAFNRMTTPPEGPHSLLLPVARVEPFRQALLTDEGAARVAAAAVAPPSPPKTTHRVRRGETLSTIARRYDVETNEIRHANNLRGSVIQPGQVLVIPKAGLAADALPDGTLVADARPEIAAQLPERQPAAAPAAKSKSSVHVVKPGDTL